MDDDVDLGAVPGEGLVHGVVDHLVHEVMQTLGARRSDVHAGALAYRLEAFEYLDVLA
jgi:hypothetical protein